MPARHSLTIQFADASLSDGSPGHAAIVVNTPEGQTYAGLGPASHDWSSLKGLYSRPSFLPQTVAPGSTPPRASDPLNYSTVAGHKAYSTFTIPVTEEQAKSALAEIARIKDSGENYNAFIRNYCTAIVDQIVQAALGIGLPTDVPGINNSYFSDVEKTLRLDPKAEFSLGGYPIPDVFRGIQRDYAYVGGGYDTPSERLGHVPSSSGPPNLHMWRSGTSPVEFVEPGNGEDSSTARAVRVLARRTGNGLRAPEARDSQDVGSPDSFDERFGEWTSSPTGATPRNPNLPSQPQSGRPLGLFSGEPMPLWVTPPPIWGDLGGSKTPTDPDRQKETIEDWLSGLLRRRIGR